MEATNVTSATTTAGAATTTNISSNAAAAASARNVSITRKVNKLLDVDTNDQFRLVLQHTEEVCPHLLVPTSAGGRNNRGADDEGSEYDEEDGEYYYDDESSSCGYTLANLRGAKLQNAITQPLQHRVLALHDEFLAQLKEIRDVYRSVASDVKELEGVANDLHTAMADAAQRAEPLVTAVTVYREELREIKAREAQVKELMSRYNITEEETEVLHSGPIDETFLRIVIKVRSIHQSCRELLIAEHQQAVIEIMERMYLLQVQAVERLAQFLSSRCAEILTSDTPVLSEFFMRCISVTYDRPAQFLRVINEVSRARKTATIRRFYDLLSKGGNGHQPLDALANDPVRYIGTLLSWVHQSIAEEEDLLRCFFPQRGGSSKSGKGAHLSSSSADPTATSADGADDNGPSSSPNSSELEAISIKDVLDQIFEPLCKHFRTRFDQVTDRCVRVGGAAGAAGGLLSADAYHHHQHQGGAANNRNAAGGNNSGHVMLIFFQLEGILSFYSDTISQLLSPTASLAATVESAKLDTLRVFYNLLQVATSQMLSSVGGLNQFNNTNAMLTAGGADSAAGGGAVDAATRAANMMNLLPKDLSATPEIDVMLRLLKSMLDSMAEGLVPHSKRESEMAPVVGAVVDPLVSIAAVAKSLAASTATTATASASDAATAIAHDDTTISRLVFSMNVLSRIHQLLLGYPFTQARANKLSEELTTETNLLIKSAIHRALVRTGLLGRAELLNTKRAGSPTHAPLTAEEVQSVENAAKQLYSYVYTVGALPTQGLDKVNNVRQRDEILKNVTNTVCESYEQLYALVHYNNTGAGGQHQQPSSPMVNPELAAAAAAAGGGLYIVAGSGQFCDAFLKAALCHSPKQVRVLLDAESTTV